MKSPCYVLVIIQRTILIAEISSSPSLFTAMHDTVTCDRAPYVLTSSTLVCVAVELSKDQCMYVPIWATYMCVSLRMWLK